MREAFAELATLVDDAALKTRLGAAAATTDISLRVSALNEANYALRDLLIALHEHIEALDSQAAHAAETRLWSLLKTFAGRRRLYLPQG